jgi:hypothetical protein
MPEDRTMHGMTKLTYTVTAYVRTDLVDAGAGAEDIMCEFELERFSDASHVAVQEFESVLESVERNPQHPIVAVHICG